jgi:hypothetical protein
MRRVEELFTRVQAGASRNLIWLFTTNSYVLTRLLLRHCFYVHILWPFNVTSIRRLPTIDLNSPRNFSAVPPIFRSFNESRGERGIYVVVFIMQDYGSKSR